MSKNDIYVTYLNKEYVDTVTFNLFEQGTFDMRDRLIVIENLENGIYLGPDEYNDMTIYSTKDEIEDKIKKACKVYDSIHVRFFDIELDDIKNKYAKMAFEENVTIAFFEGLKIGDYCTTIPMDSEIIMNMDKEEWNKKKQKLIDIIDDLLYDSEDESESFNADYSFNMGNGKKKISIEFDAENCLYRLKINSSSDLVLEPSEVKDMIEILEFFMQKSED